MAQRWLTDLSDLVGRAESQGVPVYFAQPGVIEAMTGFHLHRGVLASMHRPELLAPAVLLEDASRVVILEDIVDHTNVGAVFRSAAGLGVDAVLVTPRCADPFYRRAVRVSMGTVFQVPWTRIDPWPAGVEVLRDHGFTVAAFALGDGAISLDDLAADQPDRLAMIFGTEGDGLSRLAIKGADLIVKIPMAGGVDSLNMAAASAVAIWALRPPSRSPFGTLKRSEPGGVGS
jgi:tRNA G18 (ribose-2'-O)-methylase SpoU